MTKKACMSNARDPENRSKKGCVCGGHSRKARKKKKKKKRPPKKTVEQQSRIVSIQCTPETQELCDTLFSDWTKRDWKQTK